MTNQLKSHEEIFSSDQVVAVEVARRAVAVLVADMGTEAKTNTQYTLSITGLRVGVEVCELEATNTQIITLGNENSYVRVEMHKDRYGDLRYLVPQDGLEYGQELLNQLDSVHATNGAEFRVQRPDGSHSPLYQMMYENGEVSAAVVNQN